MGDSDEPFNPHMLFFPYFGGGHMLPMVDIARVFASHKAKVTLAVPPRAAALFLNSIHRDQKAGLDITLHTLDEHTLSDGDMSAPPFTDTSSLRDPLLSILTRTRPDCIVVDMFHRWVSDAVDAIHIPRIVFNGNGCFSRCCEDSLRRNSPHEAIKSDTDPFILPGLPDRIEMTRSRLSTFARNGPTPGRKPPGDLALNSYGTIVNSFRDLEPAYAEHFKEKIAIRSWLVGPVSLCNSGAEDKAERGDGDSYGGSCLAWLDRRCPESVVYVSFGSLVRLPCKQLIEIAHGLEDSGRPFVWVVRNVEEFGEEWLPEGYEERVVKSGKGLVVKGWAPQLSILEHKAVGAFVTHCGWNSTLEGVTAGVPMVTWPLSADQFSNEKLIKDVLMIGASVGSSEWCTWDGERKVTIGRDKLKEGIEAVLGDSEMRRRVGVLSGKAKLAVAEGGSSYKDAEALIDNLRVRRRKGTLS